MRMLPRLLIAFFLAFIPGASLAADLSEIDFDSVFVPKTGKIYLEAGRVYRVSKTKDIRSCVLEKRGSGANPILRYYGKYDTTALNVNLGQSAGIKNIDADLGPATYLVMSSGGVKIEGVNFRGGGGLFKTRGASGINSAIRCKQLETSSLYVVYAGPLAEETRHNGIMTSYSQRPTAAIEIADCDFSLGSRNMHVFRAHNVQTLRILRSKLASAHGAALRIHDAGSAAVERTTVVGDVYLAPLAEGDGGVNMDPVRDGPKRRFYEALRLVKFNATDSTFTTGDFKITPGIVSGRISRSTISDWKASAIVDTPFPYISRPASVVFFDVVDFSHRGGDGRVFSDPAGAEAMSAKSSKFNGAPFEWRPGNPATTRAVK